MELDKTNQKPQENAKTKSAMLFLNNLLYGAFAMHMTFNFLGLSFVKYSYLLFIILHFTLILTRKPTDMIWNSILFILIEGQGRILWGYAAWSRIVFDISLVLIILKTIIVDKKLWDKDKVPLSLNVFLILHMTWFTIELFNPKGAGILASFATTKFYVFPILLFFFFLKSNIDVSDPKIQKKVFLILLSLICVAILTIVQDSGKEEFMGQLSTNYLSLFQKYARFQSDFFRPWGTTYVPGGMGTFYYSIVGFILIFKPSALSRVLYTRLFYRLVTVAALGLVAYSCFIGEVRNATIKYVGIIGTTFLLGFLGSKFKFKRVIVSLCGIAGLVIGSQVFNVGSVFDGMDYTHEVERWTKLGEEGITSQRGGFGQVFDALESRIELPLGYGLGMTTSFLPAFEARRREIVTRPVSYYWNMDNLFAFLLLELGIGALFYVCALFLIMFSLISLMLKLLRESRYEDYYEVSVAFSVCLFMFIGNWGAVALPYNPESFFFWFWVAYGLSYRFKTVETIE